jgi:hypothetical protein
MDNMDMPQGASQDTSADVDLIKQVLMKVIKEMDKMDADSLMPEHRRPAPKLSAPAPADDMPMDDSEEDPSFLPSLMDKAGSADEDGTLPEDKQDSVEPEIAAIVAAKKKNLPK